MTFCSRCGKELTGGAAYCIHCGAQVGHPWDWRWRERGWSQTRSYGRKGGGGLWGLIGFLGFLVVIGLTINNYPDVFTLIGRYVQSWGRVGGPTLPGHALGQVIIFFLTASGVWGLVVACLRFAFSGLLSRPMKDVVGASYALFLASSFAQYYAGAINGSGLALASIGGILVVIAADVIISVFVPRRSAGTVTKYS